MARTPRGQAPSQAKKNQASTKAAAKNSKISKPKKKSGATPAKAEKAKAKSGGQPAQQQPKPKEDKKNVTVDGFDDGVPSRRSSDRRKTAVDRYGLTLFFFSPKSPVPRAGPSTSKSPATSSSSLNASSSKTLDTSKKSSKSADSPKSKTKSTLAKKVAKAEKSTKPKPEAKKKKSETKKDAEEPPVKKAKAPKEKKSKEDAKTEKKAKPKSSTPKKASTSTAPADESSSSDMPATLKKTISSIVNAVSSRFLDQPADAEMEVDDGRVKVPPKQRKRKNEEPAGSSDAKFMKTIDEVVQRVTVQADSESDEGKGKASPAPKKKGKDKDRFLKPKPHLKQYFHEPTFESRDELPFVSVTAYSKLAIRAVLINNENLLKRLIDDVEHVHSLKYERSVDVPFDAATYALFNGNAKLLQMIIDDEKKPKSGRVEPVRSLLGQQTTGAYNFHMLGHGVRQIQMSRGGKEGVNALTKDVGTSTLESWIERLTLALQRNVPFRLIQQMTLQQVFGSNMAAQRVYEAVRYGNHKLAGAIVKEYGGSWFNELHQQVLINDNEPLKSFKPISVKKKGYYNNDITPFHCACVNPNEKYLAALMAVEFDINHADKGGFRPIHYAAACSSPGPLRLLLQKGAQPTEMVKGENALHRACLTGRGHNVEAIIQHCKPNDPELAIAKQKSRAGFVPIHLAAKEGHLDAIKALKKSGGSAIDFDITSGAAAHGVTALMLAAQQGHLQVVEYLVKEAGASASVVDKLKRTALTHAVMNGMTHVASFLLRLGVDPDMPDSSGNTATHYAAAYGWYFCLKLLIDAGAKLNSANDWQLTPLAVAYMKGHMALADLLLQQPGIDINCRDDQGMTLVASTLLGAVDDSTIGQLNYLIKDKGADPTPSDTAGNTPLHLLAAASLKSKAGKKQAEEEANAKLSIDVAKLLIERGVNADCANDTGATAMSIAVETGKLPLAHYLAETGAKLSSSNAVRAENTPNLLHHLVNQLATVPAKKGDEEQQQDETEEEALVLKLFNLLLRNQSQELLELLKLPDAHGLTPFLLAVSKYGHLQPTKENEKTKKKLLGFIGALLQTSPSAILQRSRKVKPKENGPQEEDEEEEEEAEQEEENEEEEENGESEEKRSDDEKKKKKQKLELDEGRSALHLLASSHQHVKDAEAKEADPLLALLAQHIKEHKEVDCSKNRLLDAVDGRGETALFAAVKNRRANVALQLMEMGCSVNAIRRLPAALRPKTPPSSKDIDANSIEKREREKSKGYLPDLVTVLMEAVRVQLTTVFEKLLKAGADVHAAESEGNTALHYACMTSPSNVAIVKQLLEAGANFEARNAKLRTPLHLACNADTGATDVSTETLACLLNYGADPFVKDIRMRLPLHYAFVKIGDHLNYSDMDPVALCTVLLPRMAGQPQSLNSADTFGCTPLHYAAKRGANICCMTLLRHSQVDRNAKDNNGNTPLALAVLHSHMACALTLLQAEADVNVTVKQAADDTAKEEETELEWAPAKKQKPVVHILSLSSAVVSQEWQGVVYLLIDIFNKKKQSLQPLLEAAMEHRKYNLSLTLLRMAKSQPGPALQAATQRTPGKKNLFHLLADSVRPSTAAGVQLQLDVAEAVLEFGVPIDEHRDDATGPFHPAFYAAKNRNVPLLRFFLEKTAKTRSLSQYVISSSGHTVLTMFQWTVPLGGEVNADETALLEELKSKHGFALDVLCRYPVPVDITATDPTLGAYWTGKPEEEAVVTPLIHAIHGRNFYVVKDLIKAGANINFADAKGMTPLMHAVRLNESDIVKLLLNFDHTPSTKELKHVVEDVYKKPGEAEDEEEEDESDGEDEEENDDNGDGDDDGQEVDQYGRAKRKQLPPLGKVKRVPRKQLATRTFNIGGSMAIPTSQYSAQDASATLTQMAKTSKADKNTKKTPFNKTSVADLNVVDSNDRNVLHHLVAPSIAGGWLNIAEIMQILIDAGADHIKKDRDGLTPLDYAKKNFQFRLAEALGEKIEETSQKIDPRSNVGKTDDGRAAVAKVGSVDLEGDAKAYLAMVRQQKAEEAEKNKAALEAEKKAKRLEPHRLSGYREIGEIVVDTSGEIKEDGTAPEPQPYDVLLNKVDFNYGLYGFYNFYRMQLIRRKGSDLYIVFTNWGRIGDDGQYQKTPFPKLADAVKEFKSIFRAKSGNDWSPDIYKKFVEHPKRYRLVNKEDDEKLEESTSALDVPLDLETSLKSALPEHLQKFMADVTDVRALAASAKRVFRNSRFDLTVTALKRDAVLKADKILNEIGEKLQRLEELRKEAHDKDKLEEGTKIYQELGNLSTEFYFLLPLRGFERSRLPMIDDLSKWSENKSAVELLLKYEVANQLLCAATGRRSQVHPFDYIFTAVGAKMQALKNEDQEAQTILHYVYNTSENAPRVVTIYKLWNEEYDRRYAETAEKIGNRWLMWHGTRSVNVLSILQAGLMVAPPQALHTGHLFGKGIYVSDSFEKSSGYCEASRSGKKYAFVCEAALGKIARMKDLNSIDTSVDPLPQGYDSVQGIGRRVPNPQYDFVLKNGVKVPFGKRIDQEFSKRPHWGYWLDHNEFIVYNPHQISLRYLVIFK